MTEANAGAVDEANLGFLCAARLRPDEHAHGGGSTLASLSRARVRARGSGGHARAGRREQRPTDGVPREGEGTSNGLLKPRAVLVRQHPYG